MSQCQNCGAEITSTFCTNCGAQVDVPGAAGPNKTVAVASQQPQSQPAQPYPAQPYPGQPYPAQPLPHRQSPLQLWLGAGSFVVALLTLVVSGLLYLKSTLLWAILTHTDYNEWTALGYSEMSWPTALTGGGVAIVAAGVSIFLKGRNRGLAIAGLVLGAIALTFGLVLAA